MCTVCYQNNELRGGPSVVYIIYALNFKIIFKTSDARYSLFALTKFHRRMCICDCHDRQIPTFIKLVAGPKLGSEKYWREESNRNFFDFFEQFQ
jgi:hypothetical protein